MISYELTKRYQQKKIRFDFERGLKITYNGYGSPKILCFIGFFGICPLFKSPQILLTETYDFVFCWSLHSTLTWSYGGGRTFGGTADGDSTKA